VEDFGEDIKIPPGLIDGWRSANTTVEYILMNALWEFHRKMKRVSSDFDFVQLRVYVNQFIRNKQYFKELAPFVYIDANNKPMFRASGMA
jgi:hypothetical protein